MPDWIRSIFNDLAAPIRTLINALGKRVTSVWSVITGFLGSVRGKWRTLRANVTSWVDAQIRHAQAIATTLKWIVTVWVPRKISQEAAAIRTWTANLIARAVNGALALIHDLQQWATTELTKLLASLGKLRDWVIGQFNALIDLTNRMAKMVFGVLATPERLAAWIVGAMFTALLRYALLNAERIGLVMWKRRDAIVRGAMHIIEDVLTQVL
jgi:fluoride ion exporter CrcB/FEX